MEKQRTSARGGTRPRTTSGEDDAGFAAGATDPMIGAGSVGAPAAGGTAMTGTPGSSTSGSTMTSGSQQGGIVDKVKERATSQLSSQKVRATDGLDNIAKAVRQTTHQLRADNHSGVAEYIDKAAEQLERFSHRLREKDVTEILEDVRQLARRQPAVFIGGSFALGLLAARFIKSSQDNGGRHEHRYAGQTDPDRYSTGAY